MTERWGYQTPPARVRPATSAERADLAAVLADDIYEAADCQAHMAAVVIVENYMSDGPGYVGLVAWVLFDGGPELHAVCIRDTHGNWIEQERAR